MSTILNGNNLFAQTNLPQTKTTQHRTEVIGGVSKPRAKIGADTAKVGATASEPIAERPPASSDPSWPANQPPSQAVVRWNSSGLEIEASNSSLDQILRQVAAQTGAKLEGLIGDQRIFGKYGPGPGCEVLSKLLEGTGYNVLISSSGDADVPREIVLSARSPSNPQTAASNSKRDYSAASSQVEPEQREDDASDQASRQSNQDPFNIGGPQRDQVEFMQEILQRQHVFDQQQEQQQGRPNNP